MVETGHENSYHYGVIGRAIEVIDAHADAPLSLDELAAGVGLSPAHFQRVFSQWVGVSPKRYQQYLALGHAKTLLRERFTVMETAASTGLSGSSRLHDLFLRWEAMSPGDYARQGQGVQIAQGWFESPFGDVLVMGTKRGICGMAFGVDCGREAAEQDMRRRWPKANFNTDTAKLTGFVEAAFGGGDVSLHLMGAPFQIKVWEALLSIPPGHATSYSEIAKAVGNPKAVRAVGTAVGRNPISWLIPCHRALRKSGELGGYHWGLGVKRAMLAYEAARSET